MRDSHYRITLDITETQSQVSLPVKKGDTSRKIYISLVEGSQPYEIDGSKCSAVFHGVKSDGTKLEEYCIIEGNTIRYDFTVQTTAAVGLVECDITLHSIETGVIASPHFNIIVDNRAIEPDVLSEDQAITFDEVLTVLGDVRNAEATRILNEEERVGAETERVSNEQTRIANEEERKANEETRKKATQSLANLNNRVTTAENERETAEDERQAAEDDRQAMWNNCVENPKIWELDDGCYYTSGFVAIDSDAMFYVHDKTLLYVSKDAEDETKKRFVLFLAYAQDIPYEIITGTTDGTSSEWHGIETIKNRVKEINENSTNEQYPSAKAVYEALLAQAIDIKIEPIGEEVQPTTFAMRSVPMTASEPATLGENVIPVIGLVPEAGSTIVSNVDGVYTIKHDGSSNTVIGLKQASGLGSAYPQRAGDIWYMGAKIACEPYITAGGDELFPPISIYVRSADKVFRKVADNTKASTDEAVDYYGTFTLEQDDSNGFTILSYRVNYQQVGYVTEKSCSFSDMVLVNLTEAYGKGNEPTADEYHAMLVGSSEGDSGDSGESGGGDIPGGDTGGGDDSGDSGNDNPGGSTDVVSDSGYKLTITTANGTETLYLYHGQKGEDGKNGVNGKDGKNGADGVSPTINVEETEDGYRLTIADKNGEQTIDLMNAPPIDTELRETVTNAIGETTVLEDLTNTLDIEVGGLNASTGIVVVGTETNQLLAARSSTPFKVVPGEVYHIWGASNRIYSMIALYDENKEFIASDYVGLESSATKFENVIYTIPETATDKNGNIKNVSYMACATKLVADSGGADICVKREVTKHNNVQSDIAGAVEDSAATKLDKVLVSPNGAEWVLTITNDGVLKAVKRRNTGDDIVEKTLTLPNNLSVGTYFLRYEDEQGVISDFTDICSIDILAEGEIASYNGLISDNSAPLEAINIGIYSLEGLKVGSIELGFLQNDYPEKLYSFAAFSDVHIGDSKEKDKDYDASTDPFIPKFQNVMNYVESKDIAFTVICGDMVDDAADESQLIAYQSVTWDLEKPVYVTMGNHETINALNAGKTFDDIKEYFKQDKHDINRELYFSFTPEGTDDVFIIFGITGLYSKYKALSIEQLDWLQKELEKNRNKRCFLFHHYFPYDGSGDAVNCYKENGLQGSRGDLFYGLLKHYKNVIYFHGHTHAKFSVQELNSMNTIDKTFGRYSINIPSLSCPTYPNADNKYSEDSKASEGYIVDVYEHGIALRGRDFVNGKYVPIGTYYLNTTLKRVEANSFKDTTGLLNSVGIKNPDDGTINE